MSRSRQSTTAGIDPFDLADRHETQGRWAEAEIIYRELLERDDSPGLWGKLAWVRMERGDLKAALSAARTMRSRAIALRSNALIAIASGLIGRVHHDAGRRVLAERYYRESIAARPRTEIYVFLARLLGEQDRAPEVVQALLRALELQRDNAEAHFLLARCYHGRGDDDRAIRHLNEALTARPDYRPAARLLAVLLWDLGPKGLDQAGELLANAMERHPSDAAFRILLAFTLMLQRRPRQAGAVLEKALADLPPDMHLALAYGYFLATDGDRPREAERFFRQALELNADNPLAQQYYWQFWLNRDETDGGE